MIAYNQLIGKRDGVIADCKEMMEMLCDTTELDTAMQQSQDEMNVAVGLMQEHIKKNASIVQSQDAYALETKRIEKRYNEFQDVSVLKCKRFRNMDHS